MAYIDNPKFDPRKETIPGGGGGEKTPEEGGQKFTPHDTEALKSIFYDDINKRLRPFQGTPFHAQALECIAKEQELEAKRTEMPHPSWKQGIRVDPHQKERDKVRDQLRECQANFLRLYKKLLDWKAKQLRKEDKMQKGAGSQVFTKAEMEQVEEWQEEVDKGHVGFKQLSAQVGSPALAAWIGRNKYGSETMKELGKEGRSAPEQAAHLKGKGKKGEAKKLTEKIGKGVDEMNPLQQELAKAQGVCEAALLMKAGGQKPPAGFSPMPGSKHGGYHKRVGGKFVSWYPSKGHEQRAKASHDPKHATDYLKERQAKNDLTERDFIGPGSGSSEPARRFAQYREHVSRPDQTEQERQSFRGEGGVVADKYFQDADMSAMTSEEHTAHSDHHRGEKEKAQAAGHEAKREFHHQMEKNHRKAAGSKQRMGRRADIAAREKEWSGKEAVERQKKELPQTKQVGFKEGLKHVWSGVKRMFGKSLDDEFSPESVRQELLKAQGMIDAAFFFQKGAGKHGDEGYYRNVSGADHFFEGEPGHSQLASPKAKGSSMHQHGKLGPTGKKKEAHESKQKEKAFMDVVKLNTLQLPAGEVKIRLDTMVTQNPHVRDVAKEMGMGKYLPKEKKSKKK